MGTRRQTVFLDTNAVLDIIDSKRMGSPHARQLLWHVADSAGSTKVVSSITSFKDAYYVLCRLYRDEPRAREDIRWLMEHAVEPVDMRAAYGQRAFESDEPDFEDGLIRACAEAEGADVIITRDAGAFKGSCIPAMSAEAYLMLHNVYYEEVPFLGDAD